MKILFHLLYLDVGDLRSVEAFYLAESQFFELGISKKKSQMEEPKEASPQFEWGKKRGVGGAKKDVQFYDSFTFDGVQYSLYDCVYTYKAGEPDPYIGKIVKIWEQGDGKKRVKLLWFFHPSEIVNYLGDTQPLDNELFLASGEGTGLANINPLVNSWKTHSLIG